MRRLEPISRRRLLGAAGAAAVGAVAGCQTGDSGQRATITPAEVPDSGREAETLVVRHAAAGESGPAADAMTDLLNGFAEARPTVAVREAPMVERPPPEESGVVRFGRLGSSLLFDSGIDGFESLEERWEELSAFPAPLLQTAFWKWDTVAIPMAVDRVNCLYYNPTVLAEAGVDPRDYATIRDFASERARLDVAPFVQPLRTPRDRLALWESLLTGRLGGQWQYDQLLAGEGSPNRVFLENTLVDYDAALSLLPDDSTADPRTLLDRVADGSVGFVRLPGRATRYLRDKSGTEYGEDWAIAPMFGSLGTECLAVDGFAIPESTASLGTPRAFVRFGTERDPMARYCRTRGTVPARADVAESVTGPARKRLAAGYLEGSAYPLSFAYGVGVRAEIRTRLADVLSAFETHRDTERATEELIEVFEDAPPY